mmetsp:Transcript_68205/g.181533  ORF Transcript_68205/g.181533 Transcript_68205/m.181533 type:complete len:204 (+) Transcript_68205:131-742(+)
MPSVCSNGLWGRRVVGPVPPVRHGRGADSRPDINDAPVRVGARTDGRQRGDLSFSIVAVDSRPGAVDDCCAHFVFDGRNFSYRLHCALDVGRTGTADVLVRRGAVHRPHPRSCGFLNHLPPPQPAGPGGRHSRIAVLLAPCVPDGDLLGADRRLADEGGTHDALVGVRLDESTGPGDRAAGEFHVAQAGAIQSGQRGEEPAAG